MARVALSLTALLLALPAVAGAAPGDIDRGFARGGSFTLSFGDLWATSPSLAIQPSGRIVTGAFSDDGSESQVAVLIGLRPDGRRDRTYGDRGRRIDPPDNRDPVPMPDGRTLLVRDKPAGTDLRMQITRLTVDGGVDPSFGTGGTATLTVQGWSPKVAVAPDGGIVLALSTRYTRQAGTPYETSHGTITLVRLAPDGSPDPTFGTNGMVTISQGEVSLSADAIGIQPTGAIVLASEYHPEPVTRTAHLLLMRLSPTGTFDRFFGPTGNGLLDIREPGLQSWDMRIDRDDEIVVAGTVYVEKTEETYTVVRRIPGDGRSEGGRRAAARGLEMSAFALDGRGRPVIAGSLHVTEGPAPRYAVTRLTGRGIDRSFGRRGIAPLSLAMLHWPEAVAVQADGRILVAAGAADLVVTRLWGGDDHRRPSIAARRACSGPDRLRVAVRDRSAIPVLTVHADGRVLKQVAGKRLGIHVPARRPVVVEAVDASGNSTRRHVPACARP